MAVTLQQVKAGVNSYVDAELGRKAQGVTKFGVYFMLPRVDKMVDKYYNQAVNNPLFADMFDENGNVDIDAVDYAVIAFFTDDYRIGTGSL
jgi:hypothetical protein